MKIILTIAIIFTCFQGFSQNEPEKFNKKDLIEKMDRSDLEMKSEDEVEIDDAILKFEIPKIKFEKPVKKSQMISKKTTKTPKKAANGVSSSRKPEKNSPVNVKPIKEDKIKVVFAKRPILISQMNKNDKIVITKGKTYVYRLQKDNNIIQYKYNGIIPYESSGLRKNDETSYYVVNKKILIDDYKKLKSNSSRTKTKLRTNKPKTIKSTQSSVVTKPETKKLSVKKDKNIDSQLITDALEKHRKIIEDKYNKGKRIKKSIKLKNLHQNDEVYIVGDLQFVSRVSSSSSAKKKYWLTEKLDINNKAVEKIGKNKYKIIRFYKVK